MSHDELVAAFEPDRDETVKLLREVAAGRITQFGTTLADPRLALRVLLKLPDPPILDSFGNQVGNFVLFGPWGILDRSLLDEPTYVKNPQLIPYYARSLFVDEGGAYNQIGSSRTHRSVMALRGMLDLVRVCDEFPPEVKAWGRTVFAFEIDPRLSVRVGREWWTANEAAIRSGKYAEVKPGKDPRDLMPNGRSIAIPPP
jgi:hypothetical protein